MTFRLQFLPEALDEWRRLDNSVRQELKKKLAKRLESPRIERARLHGPLADCYKIKADKSGHRLVYFVQDSRVTVVVLAVGQRERLSAYAEASARLDRWHREDD